MVGSYTEVLKWFNYPCHSKCEVSQVRQGQPNSGESCIVLETRPTCQSHCQLSAAFSHHLQYANFMPQGKNGSNEAMCANLWHLMSWCPKCIRTIAAMWAQWTYLMDSLRKNLAWWAVTQRISKNHKTVKIGGWALAWVWALVRDNTVNHNSRLSYFKFEISQLSLYHHSNTNSIWLSPSHTEGLHIPQI